MKTLFLFAVATSLSVQAPTPPALLLDTLRREGDLAILDPERHLSPGSYTRDQLLGFGYWPPWLVADLDGDRRADIVAAVVRRSGERVLYGVIAVHARQPRRLRWVAEPGAQVLYGVASGEPRNSVVLLHCIECDSNSWYRWSGRSYEAELFLPGEQIEIATNERDVGLGLFQRQSRTSRLLAEVLPCTPATVVRLGGDERARWYLVELPGPKPVRGWIPSSFAASSECMG